MSDDCACDYDPASFYRAEIRTARKPHICEECGAPILPGEIYEHVTGKWDNIASFKTCRHCVDIRQWTANNVPCLCWAHGHTIEDCRDAIEAACLRAPAETLGLRFGFLRRVVERDTANKAGR